MPDDSCFAKLWDRDIFPLLCGGSKGDGVPGISVCDQSCKPLHQATCTGSPYHCYGLRSGSGLCFPSALLEFSLPRLEWRRQRANGEYDKKNSVHVLNTSM